MNRLPEALFISLAVIIGAMGASIGQEREKAFTPGFGKQKPSPVERAKPCEAQGSGFRAVPGGASCIRVFGGVRMEGGGTRAIR